MSLYARPVESDPESDPGIDDTNVGGTSGPRRSDPFRVLRTHRNFRLFWTGQTASLVGTWMQTMAVGWLSLELSNSAFVVGLVASMGALPIVLFSMHAGALVDRGNKLRIVRITQTLFLLQALVLFGVTLSGHVSVGLLLALSLVQGVLSAVEIPARQSLIIQLVGREDLQPAIALNSSGFNLARVVGPAVGGGGHWEARHRMVFWAQCLVVWLGFVGAGEDTNSKKRQRWVGSRWVRNGKPR